MAKYATDSVGVSMSQHSNGGSLGSSGSGHNTTDLHRRYVHVPVPADLETRGPIWTFPGAGSAKELDPPSQEIDQYRQKAEVKHHQLGEWPATGICGNDILSSVLYSSGLVAVKAGKLAPIAMLLVSLVLYFFRFIYEEVVTAIPLNGGSYNVLLNTLSKRVAAFGAALGILSYLATGVVSGTSACYYLQVAVDIPVVPSTVGLLLAIALLNLLGITDSARVALTIFLHHVVVLTVLSVACLIHFIKHTEQFKENMHSELPPIDLAGTFTKSNVFYAIYFGFSAAMLGITGFESSAQYVEEQKPGVFRKTLRNMWAFSSSYNFFLGVMALGVLPVATLIEKKDTVLAEMALASAGRWLEVWVAIDAFAVLSGAVLTSYVGITGLMRRLASDRILPAFLVKQNKWRKTNHYIIFLYFLVASSLVVILKGDNVVMGGVYTYSFLSLMALFSFGCMVLKTKRKEIPRAISAPWWSCIMGFTMVVLGMLGNLLGDPKVLTTFSLYFIGVVTVMMIMLERVTILKVVLAVMKKVLPSRSRANEDTALAIQDGSEFPNTPVMDLDGASLKTDFVRTGARGGRTITNAIIGINEAPIVFFCKHPDMTIINKAILYVRKNEQTHNLRIVHMTNEAVDGGESGSNVRRDFESIITLFDHIYPKLKIDFVSIHGEFEPGMVLWVSETMKVPINLMFIAQPGDVVVHKVSTLGVRVITA